MADSIGKSILEKWRQAERWFVVPARIITSIIFYSSIIFILAGHFLPEIFEHLTDGIDRTDTLLSLLIFLISGSMKYMFHNGEVVNEKFNNLNHIIANGSLTQHQREIDALPIIPDLIQSLSVKKVDLIQMSGQNVVPLITRIGQIKPNVKFRLLLLDPELANRHFENQKYELHVTRVIATIEQLRVCFNIPRVEVRFYTSYPSLCSVIIDNNIASLAWYRSFHSEGKLVVHGHDSGAIIDNRSESGLLRAFAIRHFNALWNDQSSFGIEEFNKRYRSSKSQGSDPADNE